MSRKKMPLVGCSMQCSTPSPHFLYFFARVALVPKVPLVCSPSSHFPQELRENRAAYYLFFLFFFLTNCDLFVHSLSSHCVLCSSTCKSMPLIVTVGIPELRENPVSCFEGNSTDQS